MSWTALYHLGDLPLTCAADSAIAVWLVAGGERRAAFRWMLAFGLALTVVGASKIAYLGWDTALPLLRFKALSGHAAGSAATYPMLGYLSTRGRPPAARLFAVTAAVSASLAVAVALVLARQHTLAEAALGWLVGTAAALATVRALPAVPPRRHAGGALAWSVVAFTLCILIVGIVPTGYLMVRAALALSGNAAPTPWKPRPDFPTKLVRRQACSIPSAFTLHGSEPTRSTKHRGSRC
jgi:hypothetical protein